MSTEFPYIEESLYHAHAANGSSDIKTAYKCIHEYYLSKYGPPRHREPTSSMLLGSVVDTMVTEPKQFESRYVVLPKGQRKAKGESREVIREDGSHSYQTALAMKKALDQSEVAQSLLNLTAMHCESQASRFATINGVEAKCRCDILHEDYCVDLKTTVDATPQAFGKQAIRFGYHMQAEWYRRILRATGCEIKQFYFVVVQSSWPWTVGCYTLPANAQLYAKQQVDRACEKIKTALETSCFDTELMTNVVALETPDFLFS